VYWLNSHRCPLMLSSTALAVSSTRSELMEKQGWKVFDLTETEHVHARVMLDKLPDKKYTSVEEVIGALK